MNTGRTRQMSCGQVGDCGKWESMFPPKGGIGTTQFQLRGFVENSGSKISRNYHNLDIHEKSLKY